MNRKELKKNAKSVLKHNYIRCIIVAFVVGLLLNSGYNFTSQKVDTSVDSNVQTTQYNAKESNYNLLDKVLENASPKTPEEREKEKKARGVLAPIVNKITDNKSSLLAFLNCINLFFFKNDVNGAVVSFIAALILYLNYVFIQNLIQIGSSRFYMEIRRYKQTNIDRVLFPYKTHRIIYLGYVSFMKNFYLFLWNFTIIGGVIKHYEYFMINYILAENPYISKKDAFKLSREMMRGHKWELFKLDFSLTGWQILSTFTFGLSNMLFLDGYTNCIYAEYYMWLRNERRDITKEYLNDDKLDISECVDSVYSSDLVKANKKKDKDSIYDTKYGLTSYILFFFTFACVGWLWEVFLHLVTEGRFVNRGTMFGPWLPIYGVGCVLILLALKPFRKNQLLYFISAIVLCGVLEYSTSWALEVFKGLKWWDYSGYFLNLHGRICLEGLLVFGLGGCAVTYLIAPLLNRLYNFIVPTIRIIICSILLFFFGVDIVYSVQHPNTGDGITNTEAG